ncbi:MAG: alpha-glycosidase [Oscillospiraceae bacterium]|nr:alpha-glycosidase [Oscillospiraceae bacterium]
MNLAAICHEATQRWCHAVGQDRFVIRIQTAKDDVKSVTLHTRDKYIPLKFFDSRKTYLMEKVASDGLRDYYEVSIFFRMPCLRYCFRIEGLDGTEVILALDGFVSRIPEDKERLFDCCQNLREEALFQVPQWAKHQILYQIFPSRFATDRAVSDKVWYQAPIGAGTDLGGNLRGIIEKLDYIHDLGADVVYMTPVFASRSSHKYDTLDYYTIDPSFGTTEDLIELVDKAHSMGMRVILDAVFNHTAPEFFAFDDLKKSRENSPYRNWYYVEEFPIRVFPKPNYKCFGYFGGMPKLNLLDQECGRYFTDVALYWLEKTGIDGWRLDVGDEVSHAFWRGFRREIKARFPEALIVGEIWHQAPDFLEGDQWDTVMNYPFHRAVEDFAATDSIPPSAYLGRLGQIRGNTHTNVQPLLWNLIGSHDTPRILHRCGGSKARQRLCAALLLLSPGMAMLYYGDEVALTGGADPDCRRGMLWDDNRQDKRMLAWYKRLIQLRKTIPAITEGKPVREEARDDDGLILIRRIHPQGNVTILFHSKETSISLPEFAGKTDLISETVFSGLMEGIGVLVFGD